MQVPDLLAGDAPELDSPVHESGTPSRDCRQTAANAALDTYFAGKLTVRYADREEVIEAGDAFYLPPGHVPAGEAGTDFVQFSPGKLWASEAAMASTMQQMQGALSRRAGPLPAVPEPVAVPSSS